MTEMAPRWGGRRVEIRKLTKALLTAQTAEIETRQALLVEWSSDEG